MNRLLCTLTAVLVAGPAAAAEPAARSEPPRLLADGLGETAIGLVVVLLLILALAWAFKRFGNRLPIAGRGPVQVLGGVSLGTRERAVLLSVGDTRLLVGVAPGQVRTLHVLGSDATAGDEFDIELQQARREARR
jgi:flagellar protein FliO/FliZ